ncbi:hypothetical protein L5515_016962 [Caenorhabditis briggsae]|uniref:Uncharacterized protein n=1 Tax=Caenorhabditis briggsae TaxID=6238 RepID=A0AAE9FIB6_CAEBR|nr:hypothetical protein L5515_016962 [Caenorhabditis briggsae]
MKKPREIRRSHPQDIPGKEKKEVNQHYHQDVIQEMLSTLQALCTQHIFVSHTRKHTCDRSHALFQPNVVTPNLENDGSRRPVPSDYANRYSSENLEAGEKTQEAKDEMRRERRGGEAVQDRSAKENDEEYGKRGKAPA